MDLIISWILFIYICGSLFKLILSIPFLFRMPQYFLEVYGKPADNKFVPILIPMLSIVLFWPILLFAEGWKFFWLSSEETNKKFFVSVLEQTRADMGD